jgi:hypothetical protein
MKNETNRTLTAIMFGDEQTPRTFVQFGVFDASFTDYRSVDDRHQFFNVFAQKTIEQTFVVILF